MAVSRSQVGTSSGICSVSRARASAASGRAFAPSRHQLPNAGQAAARCSRILGPGRSSSNARRARLIASAGGGSCHGRSGPGPGTQSVAARRCSQPRQSAQSTPATHCCQACQSAGAGTRSPSPGLSATSASAHSDAGEGCIPPPASVLPTTPWRGSEPWMCGTPGRVGASRPIGQLAARRPDPRQGGAHPAAQIRSRRRDLARRGAGGRRARGQRPAVRGPRRMQRSRPQGVTAWRMVRFTVSATTARTFSARISPSAPWACPASMAAAARGGA